MHFRSALDTSRSRTRRIQFIIFIFIKKFFCFNFCLLLQRHFFLVSHIKNANLFRKFLVSYYVTSLFSNIPLQETIDIAINLIFNHNPNLNITKMEIKNLFLFAASQTHFIFNFNFIIKLMEQP